ncbi:MAG: undecaprenyl-diphosphate phosphatase [Deltaproteobacteria bacterium]|nr:undecaprenyl-diphosphate phosphatase [Deltaproteobacteria bacterium]
MDLFLVAVLLGIVEGVTEFLPVSSTGHLILAGHALGFTGERADIFEVVIQAGAMLAVLGLYRQRLAGLLQRGGQGFRGLRGLTALALTSAPALALGFVAHHAIKARLFNPVMVAAALLVGAAGILVVEQLRPRVQADSLDGLTPRSALGIGLFQCLALWPGMSRSASTIMGGMLLGVSRQAATEYSFLAALPIIGAATLYDLFKGVRAGSLHAADAPLFLVGLLVSAVAAWGAIRLFVRFVSVNTLRPFAVYRAGLALLVLLFPQAFGP